jgi:O-antigen/teichoic acid export membrane protein
MQVVCFSLIFAAISSQLNAILQGTGRVEIVSYITVVSTLICLVGIVLAAPRYGALGAGWSLSLSYVLQTALLTCVVVVAMRRDPHA